MGKILSVLTRPIKNYNIENRAHKVISKEKPTPAPMHKASLKEAERYLKENPDSYKDLLKKDTVLDVHLKDVYVKSHDPKNVNTKTIQKSELERSLPLNRKIVEQFEYGFYEPANIPIGRCTLRQVLKFLTNHLEDSTKWNSTKIAIEYKIPEDTIKNIIKYYRVYKVYIPEMKSKYVVAEPSVPKKSLDKLNLTKLLENDDKKDDKSK